MEATSAPFWLLLTSSSLAAVVGKGAFYKAGNTDWRTCTLEFLKATLR